MTIRKGISLPQILKRLRQWSAAYESQRAAALAAGVSPQYLSEMLLGHKVPSDSLLKQINVRRVVVYEEIEK